MARVFIKGSSDGLGKMAAQLLIAEGHNVVLHARSASRADEIRKTFASTQDVVIGDLSSIAKTKSVADQVNGLGSFDAVIHNAGIGYREPKPSKTSDGVPQLFAVNSLALYLLTALIIMPSDWSISPPACTTAPDRIWMTCYGRSGGGTVRKHTPKPSFRMCCWHSRWRTCFHKRNRTLSNRDGCPPRWAAPAPRTTSTRRTGPRCGLRPATIRRQPFPEGISSTKSCVIRTGKERHRAAGSITAIVRKCLWNGLEDAVTLANDRDINDA